MDTIDSIEKRVRQHHEYTLLIGEQLAFLKRDWEEAYGQGLSKTTLRRRWAAFLREHTFLNPEPLNPVDRITPEVADRLIEGFQRHLLEQHIQPKPTA